MLYFNIEDLTCTVCNQLLKDPKYLPCHHLYCKRCLEKMQVQSKIICPECSEEAVVPLGGVNDLPYNLLVNRILYKLALKRKVKDEVLKCDECIEKEPVIAFCTKCDSNLCQSCLEIHKRNKKFCGHFTVLLVNQRSSKDVTIYPEAATVMCKEHNLELLLYCEPCKQLVCEYCVLKSHHYHKYVNARMKVCKCQIEIEKVVSPPAEGFKNVFGAYGDTTHEMKKVNFLCSLVCIIVAIHT